MKFSKLEKQILLLGMEDFSGLWEVRSETNGIYENMKKESEINIARKILIKMINQNLIELYRCREPKYYENFEKVVATDINQILLDDTAWDFPEQNSLETIRILVSDKGEKAFLGKKVE
jgi:hypothetical protein